MLDVLATQCGVRGGAKKGDSESGDHEGLVMEECQHKFCE